MDSYQKEPEVAGDNKPVTCKPLFFDLALNHLEMPSLDQETNTDTNTGGGLTGLVKGLWGWK